MLELYLDDSGAHGQDTLILAGYLAGSEEWREFTNRCDGIRDEFKVPFFHTKQLRNLNSPIYGHLSVSRRTEMLLAMANAIGETAIEGIYASISPSQYRSATTHEFQCRHGSAIARCVESILHQLWEGYTDYGDTTQRISVFIEGGHANTAEAIDLILKYKGETDPEVIVPNSLVVRDMNNLRGEGLLI